MHGRAAALFLACEGLLLAGLSQLSLYALRRPGYVVNLDIAMMLTPFGIGRNFWWNPASPWRRFYFRESPREGLWHSAPLALLVLTTVGLALAYLAHARRERR